MTVHFSLIDYNLCKSAQNGGYNVFIWTLGELPKAANDAVIPPEGAQPGVIFIDDSYRSVEYDDVINDVQCFDEEVTFDQTRFRCEAYQGPAGTDPVGSWVPFSIRSEADMDSFKVLFDNGSNGCNHADWMWLGLTDDFDGSGGSLGQTCASEGTWTDLWGNLVGYESWTGGHTNFPASGDNGQQCDGDIGTDDIMVDGMCMGADCVRGNPSQTGSLNDNRCHYKDRFYFLIGCSLKISAFQSDVI